MSRVKRGGKHSVQEPRLVLHSLYKQLLQIISFFVLIGMFGQKSNVHSRLAWTRPYKSQIGHKWEKMWFFKSRESYYIISMHRCYQLTLFLALIGEFDQKSNSQPRLVWITPYKSQIGPKRGENIFKSREWYCIVLMYKYYLLNLFRILILKFDQMPNFQPRLD